MIKFKFFKMHGLGNDYVFIDARKSSVQNPEKIAVFVSNRRFSIGSDGLVLITPSEKATCGMQIYNADGSRGATCGNALRCVAKYLYKQEQKRTAKAKYTIETDSGICHATVEGDSVSVEMGTAQFRAACLPPVGLFVMPFNGREFVFTAVSIGNPHAVAFVDNFDFDLGGAAKELSDSGVFPFGVNVEFVIPQSNNKLKMRVIERGSGETLCCGSGACAAAAVAARYGVNPFCTAEIECLGGSVFVTVKENYSLTLSGGAEFAFKGEFCYE